jgi:dephospho-CoA kinase
MSKENGQGIYALTGASATGKSTLLERFRELNPEYGLVEEAARKYYAEHVIPKAERGSYENQSRIQSAYLKVSLVTVQY